MHTIAEKKLLMLKPSEIMSSPDQPRKFFDEYELKVLADSIATSGIIQPLAVRKSITGEYILIAGERRLRAAVIAGLRRVPCILHKTDDSTAAFYSVVENLQRTNLNIFEEAEGISRLVSVYGLTQSEVAMRLGIAQSTLSNKLRLLRLNGEMRERIISAQLTERHARALLRIPEEKREECLNKIIAEGLTLQQTEQYIDGLLNPQIYNNQSNVEEVEENEEGQVTKTPTRRFVIGDLRLFSNSLSKLVDTLQTSGLEAKSCRHETEKYIEYKVRIKKSPVHAVEYKQLKIC